MRALFLLAAMVLWTGTTMAGVGDPRAVGHYYTYGLDSRRNLDLREDGTFVMVLKFRGEDLTEKKVEERGTWILKGDVVTLAPEKGEKYGDGIWYSCLLLKRDGKRRRLLVGVRGARGYNKMGFDEVEETEANQALEPTSTAVTPPASAGDRASGTRGSP